MARSFGYVSGLNLISGNQRAYKRTLGARDKKILYVKAKKRCEIGGEKIVFEDMEVGHKNAWAKGGSTTLRNSICVCHKHNRLQGTDSYATIMRKLGKSKTRSATSPKYKKRKTKKNWHWEINYITGKRYKVRNNTYGF